MPSSTGFFCKFNAKIKKLTYILLRIPISCIFTEETDAHGIA
jgi:hypothetical protein